MKGPATGELARARSASPRTAGFLDTASALLLVLGIGLAARLIIAYLLPGSGFRVDLEAFRYWAANLAAEGPFGFYDRPFFHDYTPGYLYVLWLVGIVGQALGGIGDLIKLPAIIADVVMAGVVWAMVRELGGRGRIALLGAALVIVNPVTWFDSSIWGQVDSVGVVFLLLALWALWRNEPELAAILGTMAAVTKPQLGIIVPIVAAVVIRRAFFGSTEIPPAPPADRADGGALGRLRRWMRTERGPARILSTGAAGLLTAILLSAPFGLSIVALFEQVLETAGGYPYLTVNAYNPWALVTQDGNGLAANGTWLCDVVGGVCDSGVLFGPIPAVVVGSGLILAVVILASLVAARHDDRLTILVALTVIAIAFFVVPTRVHERYLYPFFALGAILAAVSWRWRVGYVLLAGASFLNLYVVLTTLYPDNPGITDWLGIGPAIRSPAGVALIALVHLAVFSWGIAQLRRSARRTLTAELDHASGAGATTVEATGDHARSALAPAGPAASAAPETRASGPPPTPADASDGAAGQRVGRAASAAPGAPRTAATAARGRSPAPTPMSPQVAAAGPLWGFWGRVTARPLRPDRSRALDQEATGRFDRLDVWILVVLVLATFLLRTYRVEEPYHMYFDEIYHARTATEFLQYWRYGEPHPVYEYTHPHLAKYAMAGGIVLFGDNRVTATSALGAPALDAVIEPRWEDPGLPGTRAGDRMYVATGEGVVAYDLATRAAVATIVAPGASAVTVDASGHRLLIGATSGAISVVETARLDALRSGGGATASLEAAPIGALGSGVKALHVTDDGSFLLVGTDDDRVVSLDAYSGVELGAADVAGLQDLAPGGSVDTVVVSLIDFVDSADLAPVGAGLAAILDDDPADLAQRLTGALLEGRAEVVLGPAPQGEPRAELDTAIADGRLPGVAVQPRARAAASGSDGVTFLAAADASITSTLDLAGPADGIAYVTGVDTPRLYVAVGSELAVVTLGDNGSDGDPALESRVWMPGPINLVAYNAATRLVHAEGATPDGAGHTVYVVEPHGNAVFADAPIAFAPVALVVDAAPLYPTSDREQLLAVSADGSTAAIQAGRNAFGWRLPGVVAGVLMALFLYLLARILFRRRSIALLAGGLVLADGMLFAQSRIAMNDVYAGLFIVAAITVFAAVWAGAWRWRGAFWVALPVVGLLLGLALASKWVAVYAIGAIAIMLLARSALGRVVLIGGLTLLAAVLGYLALVVPEGGTSGGNLTFLVVMVVITVAAVIIAVWHPVAWSAEEVRFAVGAPVALGVAAFLAGVALAGGIALSEGGTPALLSAIGFGLVLLGALAAGLFWLAGRLGFGPLAPPVTPGDPREVLPPPSPAPSGWLRPGYLFGLPVVWAAISLLAVPLVVYVLLYLPWVAMGGHQIVEGWPAGNNGQTLLDLTRSMYDYHNNLRATHAAASPWWAWPLNLKPVWFYQGAFAGNTAAAIYDTGNSVIWWLGIVAMGFVSWQAFRRRSLSLAVVVIAFAAMWLPWARIDRVVFQYHYYTALPFVVLALAYLLAELWHGASRRTWLLARLAAGGAIVLPAVMWLFKAPLCWFVGVERVYESSPACVGNPGNLVVTTRVLAIVVILAVTVVVIGWQLLHLDRPDARGQEDPRRRLVILVATAIGAALLLALVPNLVGDAVIISMQGIPSELIALGVLVPLGLAASLVLTARDARRFVAGTLVAAVTFFVVLYPNIAALPLPAAVVNAYQGLLPTYLYPFQFPVNTDPSAAAPILGLEPATLFLALLVAVVVVGYSAWVWRVALAERSQPGTDDDGVVTSVGRT